MEKHGPVDSHRFVAPRWDRGEKKDNVRGRNRVQWRIISLSLNPSSVLSNLRVIRRKRKRKEKEKKKKEGKKEWRDAKGYRRIAIGRNLERRISRDHEFVSHIFCSTEERVKLIRRECESSRIVCNRSACDTIWECGCVLVFPRVACAPQLRCVRVSFGNNSASKGWSKEREKERKRERERERECVKQFDRDDFY